MYCHGSLNFVEESILALSHTLPLSRSLSHSILLIFLRFLLPPLLSVLTLGRPIASQYFPSLYIATGSSPPAADSRKHLVTLEAELVQSTQHRFLNRNYLVCFYYTIFSTQHKYTSHQDIAFGGRRKNRRQMKGKVMG